jgi:hypothetical protein
VKVNFDCLILSSGELGRTAGSLCRTDPLCRIEVVTPSVSQFAPPVKTSSLAVVFPALNSNGYSSAFVWQGTAPLDQPVADLPVFSMSDSADGHRWSVVIVDSSFQSNANSDI